MSQTPDLMAARYGKKKGKTSVWTIVLTSAIAVTFFSFAIYASFIGKPLASVELTSYQAIDENHIEGNFTALTGDQPASCVFKAYATRGVVVGFVEVEIPANNSESKALKVVVKTLEPASVLRADGCAVK